MVVFVDTSAWFANAVPKDKNHAAAAAWMDANMEDLTTSDFVVDEILTLLRVRGEDVYAVTLGKLFFESRFVEIVTVTEDDLKASWHLFHDYKDKQWSFTDCTSKVVMERLGITTAFAFDQHFRQFGSVDVVP